MIFQDLTPILPILTPISRKTCGSHRLICVRRLFSSKMRHCVPHRFNHSRSLCDNPVGMGVDQKKPCPPKNQSPADTRRTIFSDDDIPGPSQSVSDVFEVILRRIRVRSFKTTSLGSRVKSALDSCLIIGLIPKCFQIPVTPYVTIPDFPPQRFPAAIHRGKV